MALAVGTRLGTFEIIGQIGAGGMGEVYRATDTKLGRDVAIKTLPAALASDKDRLARFEREAKLLAALNHAHIASVHSLDEHEGTQYLAMELVEGGTLEEKLKSGALPVEEALRIALQIAEALEAAHEKGVVHRDLKPANIMLTADGEIKVLDFGLAKAFSGDPDQAKLAHSPALSVAMTQQGLILGTAGYMSPEQASGQATDQRADTWAFGVVLYEMLTGLPVFSGESVPHILAAVLQTEPDWSRLPRNLHPRLKPLLERCLEKKVRNRYHSIADVRIEIEKIAADPQGATAPPPIAQPLSRQALPLAAAFVLGAFLAGLGAWRLQPAGVPQRQPQPVNRFDWALPADQRLAVNTLTSVIALSPDGRRIVYGAGDGLHVRSMGDLRDHRIPGADEPAGLPLFSPDGRSVAYFTRAGELKRVAIVGGTPVVIAGGVGIGSGGSWGPDGSILFGQSQGVFRVPASGGTPKLVVPAKPGEQVYGPQLLPDGDSVLFSVTTDGGDWNKAQVVVQSLSTGKRTVLIKGGSDARYVRPGYLVYALGDKLFAAPLDAGTLAMSRPPEPVVQGVLRGLFGATGAADYGVSADGTLVYVVSGNTDTGWRTELVWVDREGHEEPLGLEPCICENPAVSPDGKHVAVEVLQPSRTAGHIWIWSLAQHRPTRLTFEPGLQTAPVWTPDSTRLAYSTALGGIFLRHVDGTGGRQQLFPSQGVPWAWTPDGELIFSDSQAPSTQHFDVLPSAGDRKPKVMLTANSNEWSAALSPNGHWLAYQSDETGRYEIYVRPFPDVDGGKWQISTGGGEEPKWARNGHTLFFLGPKSLMATTVETTPGFSFRTPEAVLNRSGYLLGYRGGPPASYDVSPDGKRFLLLKIVTGPRSAAAEQQRPARIVIVQHWPAGLGHEAPAK